MIAFFQSIQMLCPTAIVILLLTGTVRPWMIIVLSVMVGVTDALSMPSFSSIVPSIVPREQIGAGLALNSTQFSLSRILGPSLAGVLMSSIGAIAASRSAPLVRAVHRRRAVDPAELETPGAGRRRAGPAERSSRASARSCASRRCAARCSRCSSRACSAGPLVTFMPVLVKQVFHGSAGQFSAAVVAFGAGGLLGGAGLMSVPPTVDRRRVSLAFALAQGALLVATALCTSYWLLLPLLMLAGAAITVGNIAANALLQATTAPGRLGRTVSLYMLAVRGGMSVGALLTGATVSLLGVQHALLINGAVAVALQLAVGRSWLSAPVRAPA